MPYNAATAGPILKEKFDSRVGDAISKRDTFYSWFRKKVEKVDVNQRGYYFSVKTQRNQGYGSLDASSEGGLLPTGGQPARRKVRVDFRDHFVVGEMTGRIKDAQSDAALLNMAKDAMADAEESFTTFQDFYLFGNGVGALGICSGAGSGGSVAMALSPTNPYGSMMIQPGQSIKFYHPTTFAQLVGTVGAGALSVASVSPPTDTITCTSNIPSDVASGSLVCLDGTINRETQGLDYHVGNFGTTWLVDGETGTAITRAGAPWTSANVAAQANAVLTGNMIDTICTQTTNQMGDGKPKWDQVLISHPAQQLAYKRTGMSPTTATPYMRTAPTDGSQKTFDLGFADVAHNGMEWRTSAHCPADRLYGLRIESWRMPEVKAPQMYEFGSAGPLIQKPGTAGYFDAQQFAVYARFNVVCVEPSKQFALTGLNVTAADIRRTLW